MPKLLESTTKDVTAGNQGVSRSIVSASKPIFCALKTVNARIAKILREVKKEGLCSMKTIIQSTCNKQLMQRLVVPLDLQAMGPL